MILAVPNVCETDTVPKSSNQQFVQESAFMNTPIDIVDRMPWMMHPVIDIMEDVEWVQSLDVRPRPATSQYLIDTNRKPLPQSKKTVFALVNLMSRISS